MGKGHRWNRKTSSSTVCLFFGILGRRLCQAGSLLIPFKTRTLISSLLISAFSPYVGKKKSLKRKKKKERENTRIPHKQERIVSLGTKKRLRSTGVPAGKRSCSVGAGKTKGRSFLGFDVSLQRSTTIQTNQSVPGFRNATPAHSAFLVPPAHCL